MVPSELNEQWQAYKEAFRAYEALARSPLDERRELEGDEIDRADHALCDLAGRSERLAWRGIELLESATGEDREQISTLLVAVATADTAIACEALQLGPERPQADLEHYEAPAEAEVESTVRIVAEIDELFGMAAAVGGSGGDPTQEQLEDECREATDRLIGSAYEPALRFGGGVAAGGLAHLVLLPGLHIASDLVGHLERLERHLGRVKRQIVRLIAAGFRKLIGTAATRVDELADEAVKFFSDGALSEMGSVPRNVVERTLGFLCGRDMAEQKTSASIVGAWPMSASATAQIERELRDLTKAYGDQMTWAGRIAKLISYSAPFISTLAVQFGGPLLVLALDGVGLGFVLSTLRVKVTGRLAWRDFDGVVTIVSRACPPVPVLP